MIGHPAPNGLDRISLTIKCPRCKQLPRQWCLAVGPRARKNRFADKIHIQRQNASNAVARYQADHPEGFQ